LLSFIIMALQKNEQEGLIDEEACQLGTGDFPNVIFGDRV